MRKKFALKPAGDWETGALEARLEQEAAKGWRLTAWVSWFAVLERAEPAQCRVRIQPRAPEERADWEARLEVYRDLGWTYATQMGDYEAYYCDDPAAPELVLGWLLCAVGIFGGVRKLLGVWRTRNLLDAGVTPPHTGNWRKSRRLMAVTALLLLFWTVHLAGLGMTALRLSAPREPSAPWTGTTVSGCPSSP